MQQLISDKDKDFLNIKDEVSKKDVVLLKYGTFERIIIFEQVKEFFLNSCLLGIMTSAEKRKDGGQDKIEKLNKH